MNPIFEDRIVTIRFVVPVRVELNAPDMELEFKELVYATERALATLYPMQAGFSMSIGKREA